MPDLKMDKTNEGHSGTEIQAQPDFNQSYIFQVRERINNPPQRDVDGLRGVGIGNGNGVVGWTRDARLDRDAHAATDNTTQNLPFVGHAGVVGIGFNSSATVLDDPGVIGASRLNVGVFGSSEGGTAVRGQSGGTGDGVHGLCLGGGRGVLGHSNNGEGVVGESPNSNGVHGSAGGRGEGVVGDSPDGRGVHGVSGTREGVAGDSKEGFGVSGRSARNHGVFGDNRKNDPPPGGDPTAPPPDGGEPTAGVYGITHFNHGVAGVIDRDDGRRNFNAVGVYGRGGPRKDAEGRVVNYGGWAGFFDGRVGINGDLGIARDAFAFGNWVVFGGKFAAVPYTDGTRRLLYCLESPEPWFEDFGEAKLARGKAKVQLRRDFAAVADTRSYHVFLTPYGDSNGLYAIRRTATGFEVREQNGGSANLTFSYRLVARRKDVTGERMPKFTPPSMPGLQAPRVPRRAKAIGRKR